MLFISHGCKTSGSSIMKRSPLFYRLTLVFLSLSVISCQKYPDNVERALSLAEGNRSELERVIEHYQSPGDSLKLKAAHFLIANMIYHVSDSVIFENSRYHFDVLSYPDLWKMRAARDSLQNLYGFFRPVYEYRYDILTISSDYLIDNIELAFEVWGNPWAEHVDFDSFCEFILPYRVLREPVSDKRRYLNKRYSHVLDTIKNPKEVIEACNTVNKEITTWFGYNKLLGEYPALSLDMMLKVKYGDCDEMAAIATYAMRSVGIPVASDFVPYWGRLNAGHRFNALLMPGGTTLPFGGADAKNFPSSPDPPQMELTRYMKINGIAKVYRTTFGTQKSSLAFIKNAEEKVPPFFNQYTIRDVTASYADEIDVTLSLEEKPPPDTRFVYLCIFTSGEWKAVHWALIRDNHAAVFSDMGPDVIYRPMYYAGAYIPAGKPFLLRTTGERKLLKPKNPGETTRLRCGRIGPWMWSATDPNAIHKGEHYELFYWSEKGWESIGSKKAEQPWIDFDHAPKNGFFRLVKNDFESGRIFCLDPVEGHPYGYGQKFY